MKPKWILEKYTFEDNFDNIVSILKSKEIEYTILEDTPFDEQKEYTTYPSGDCVICYTSINFLNRLQRKSNLWVPHSYSTFENYKCSNYYKYFHNFLLNDEFIFLPFGLLKIKKDFIYDLFESNKLFFRPDSGKKLFTGKVVTKEELNDFIDLEQSCYEVDPNEMVLINSSFGIESEWRFIVCKDKVIAGCKYKDKNKSIRETIYNGEVWEFAQYILDKTEYRPDKAFSMDICKCGETYYLLELNSFSCCGLYACDLEVVIDEITKLALEDYKEIWEEN